MTIHVQSKPFTIYVTEHSENTPGRVDPGRVDSGADLTSGRVHPLPFCNLTLGWSHPYKMMSYFHFT